MVMYNSIVLFLNIGGQESIIIIFAVLLLFGGKKLPELARGLGKGIREFKDASDDVKREIHRNINSVEESIKETPEEVKPAEVKAEIAAGTQEPAPYVQEQYNEDQLSYDNDYYNYDNYGNESYDQEQVAVNEEVNPVKKEVKIRKKGKKQDQGATEA